VRIQPPGSVLPQGLKFDAFLEQLLAKATVLGLLPCLPRLFFLEVRHAEDDDHADQTDEKTDKEPADDTAALGTGNCRRNHATDQSDDEIWHIAPLANPGTRLRAT
jgi:hypothetical protein